MAIDPKTDPGVAAFMDAATLTSFVSDVQLFALTRIGEALLIKDDAAVARATELRDAANDALKAATRLMATARDGLHGRTDLPAGFEAVIDNAVKVLQEQVSALPD